jgi:DNA/RNA endonuclease YhcR with UshA esterase domain
MTRRPGWRCSVNGRALATFIVTLTFLTVSAQVFAHHGTASYDTTRTTTVKGTVTAFQFMNPHTLLFLDVTDEKGNVQKWQGELTSPNHLARNGWTKNSLKPGDQITLTGFPAKSGANSLWITKVVLADGTSLDPGLGN